MSLIKGVFFQTSNTDTFTTLEGHKSTPRVFRLLVDQLGSPTSSAEPLNYDSADFPGTSNVGVGTKISTRLYEDERLNLQKFYERTGLTWLQIANLFGVDRRSVHFWVQGERSMRDVNIQRLATLERALNAIDTGNPHSNRSFLIAVLPNGITPLELLKQNAYEDLIRARRNTTLQTKMLSNEAWQSRSPIAPAILALSDSSPVAHRVLPGAKGIKAAKAKSRGRKS